MGKVHFIGICGSGMSGLATVLLQQGFKVSGSDLQRGRAAERLENLGAEIMDEHSEKNITEDIELVVISTAIKQNNPELLAARQKGLEIIRRGHLLARLMKDKKGLAVAGAHGKTTTSSMLALVLEKNALDPTIIVGGDIVEIGGNAKAGQGTYLVAEADESDGSFLWLNPNIAIITNIEDDHLDYYGSREAIKKAFAEFAEKLPDTGCLIACSDDENVLELIGNTSKRVLKYGFGVNADYRAEAVRGEGLKTFADLYFHEEKLGTLEIGVPGKHNILNAMAVVAAGREVGLSFDNINNVLRDFRGVHRRFQLLGEVHGVTVVDDYAHHPTEVNATLQAAKQTGAKRVWAVFQPHRYSRTQLLSKEFGAAFGSADRVIINEIYAAGETPIEGVSAALIVQEVRNNVNVPVAYVNTLREISEYLINHVQAGDLVLTLGAGDIWKAGVELVAKLRER